MSKLRTLFHPIFVFVGIQVAWIALMAVWIYWYFENRLNLKELAERLRPGMFSTDFNWVVLLEGCVLMLMILTGVYVIFIYWNKQARLNRLQSNFVSSVSHELKSPLASIQLYLETLKYQDVSQEEVRDFVETMLTDTERLSGLIDNILESSRSDPKNMQSQFQSVDIEPFIREVVEGHQRQLRERQCEVSIEIMNRAYLHIDPRAMRMVFNNLIGNALRYSTKGTPLTIRVENDRKYCRIQFIDKGFGLNKKDIKKIFKKFYRVQDRETQHIEGAGLGLFISSEILKNHKGRIQVESEGSGKGSVFTVSLPLNVKGASAPGMSASMLPG